MFSAKVSGKINESRERSNYRNLFTPRATGNKRVKITNYGLRMTVRAYCHSLCIVFVSRWKEFRRRSESGFYFHFRFRFTFKEAKEGYRYSDKVSIL